MITGSKYQLTIKIYMQIYFIKHFILCFYIIIQIYLPCSLFRHIGSTFFENNNDINMTQQYLLGIIIIESKINV